MEKRSGKIIVQAPGGTAMGNAYTYKVCLPSAWVQEMGISADSREIELCFDGSVISIAKKKPLPEFIEEGRRKLDRLIILHYYDGDTIQTTIAADFTRQVLAFENHTADTIHTAFGNNQSPTWDDLQYFLEERCIPRSRAGVREYLESIGLTEYDPLEIIRKTQGRMAEDHQWIRIEGTK